MNNTGRVQVRDLNGPESLQTAARPVNSMVEQAKPVTDNSFLQLGKALAEVRPGINAYLEDMQREEASTETEAGRLQAMKSNALGWKDAVDKGLVKPGASPWFIKGYKEQQGRTIGRQWEADAMSAYEQWDGKGSDDPAQFQKFMGDFLAKRIDGVDDADVRVGLMPEVQRLQNNMSQHHASYTADRIYNQAVEGMQAEIGQLVDKAHSDAIQYKQAVDLNGLSGTIRGMEDRWKFLGIKGRDINRALVDIVTTKAIESGNERLLDLLKTARPDGTPGAGTTTYGREKMAQASHTIFNRVLQAESLLYTREQRAKADAAGRNMAFAIEKMVASGGNWTPDAGWLKQAAKSDPDIQWRLMSMGETLKQREEKTDFKSYFDSMRDVYSGTSRDPMGDVWRGIQSGSIKGSTIETAMRTAQMMSRPEANVLNNPSVKLVMNRFNDLMTPLGMSILRDPQAVMTALSIFSTEMIEWQSKNPKASPLEVHTKVMDLQKQLDTDGAFGAGFLKKGESGGRGGVTTPTGAQPQGTGQKPPGDVGAVDYRTQPLWHGMDEFMGEYREFMRHRSKQTSFFEQMVRAGVNVRNSNEVLDFFNAQKALLEHPTGN